MKNTIDIEKIMDIGKEIIDLLDNKLNTPGEKEFAILQVSSFLTVKNTEMYLESKNKI